MRRRIIFIMITVLSVNSGFAQLIKEMDNLFTTSNQTLIEDAIKDGLLIVSQEYLLQDVATKSLFGRNKQEYYGKTYSLAARLNGGYCLDAVAVAPWSVDENFAEYKNDERYIPLPSKATYRKMTDKKYDKLPFDTAFCSKANSGHLYTLTDPKGEFGFEIDRRAGLKKGWLVWVKLKDDIYTSDTTDVELQIYRTDITIKPDSSVYEIKGISKDDHLLGGVYILPEVTRIGQLTFKLVGMLKNMDNKWNVLTFGTSSGNIKEAELTPVQSSERNDSTTL